DRDGINVVKDRHGIHVVRDRVGIHVMRDRDGIHVMRDRGEIHVHQFSKTGDSASAPVGGGCGYEVGHEVGHFGLYDTLISQNVFNINYDSTSETERPECWTLWSLRHTNITKPL
ncbi:hypothetical protein RRG08_059967, partial [Elysia crispata]